MTAQPQKFSDETKQQAKPIMFAVFYLMFDSVGSMEEAVVRLIDIPSVAVGDFLESVLAVVGIRSRVKFMDGTLKLDLHAGCIVTTQTKIMQYFAQKVVQVPEFLMRLPGSEWRPRIGKPEADMTPRELMFAKTYGTLIPANRLDKTLDDSETYAYDVSTLT